MIDFPSLYPNLVKYIPNWLERFYPRIAHFARGEGYPCGNKGVFIPRRNKCWTHPKTGNRLTKPLTYQKYQEAKEKSQKSRTEKGRTALQDREQSFRDKAREKVNGWQNKKPPEPIVETENKQARKAPNYDYENTAINRATLRIETELNPKHWDGIIKEKESLLSKHKESYAKYKKRTVGGVGLLSVRDEKRAKDDLESAKLKLNEVTKTLNQEKLETFPNFLGTEVSQLTKAIGADKTKKLIQDQIDKYKPKSDPKPSPNSTGVKGAGGKSVDQQYKDIIAKSKDPKGTKVSTPSTPKGKPKVVGNFYNDDPIKNYETFKKEIPKELARVNFEYNHDGLIPVSRMKEELKGRVDKKDFDKWMMDLQGEDDNVLLVAGENSERDPDAIKTSFGKPRNNIQYTNEEVLKKGKTETKRYQGQVGDIKQFKTLLENTLDEMEKSKDTEGDTARLYKVRKAMGDNVSRGDFNKLMVELRKDPDYELSQHSQTRDEPTIENFRDSVPNNIGTSKPLFYIKRLKKKNKKNDFNSNLKLAQFGGNNLRRRKSKLANFAKPGCCCDTSKPLRRRKTKQTPRLKRRGNRYA